MDFRRDDTPKIVRRVLRQDIKSFLQEAIISGKLEPGARIIETRIAKDLGVSQAPIREALRELELMGLVESRPFQGSFVKKLSKRDIQDAYQVRANLEGLAAKEAAQKISPEQLEQLEELVKNMEKSTRKGGMKDFVEIDIAFHRLILEAAGNRLLQKLWSMVQLGQWTFITTKISKRSLPELAQRHELILESLKKKDPLEAEKRILQHFQELMEEILTEF